jgi:hypothetical protein
MHKKSPPFERALQAGRCYKHDMTMILSYITHTHAIQVSDRRVSILDKGKYTVRDDTSNKAVVYCGHVAFSYTGLAQIGAEPTDEWITRVLQGSASLDDAFERLRANADRDFTRYRINRRHAFIGVGWGLEKPGDELTDLLPLLVVVSNYHRGWREQPALGPFTMEGDLLPKSMPDHLFAAGWPLSPEAQTTLRRDLRRSLEHGSSPAAAVRLMGSEIRKFARADPAGPVGQSLMALSIPKAAVSPEGEQFLLSGPPGETATFLYVPEGADTEVFYGPNTVCGNVSSTGFRFLTGSEARKAMGKGGLPTSANAGAICAADEPKGVPVRMPTRAVRLEIPGLDIYSRPLFVHAFGVILPNVELRLSMSEGQGEILTAGIPVGILPKDVEGAVRAAFKSIGVEATPRLLDE